MGLGSVVEAQIEVPHDWGLIPQGLGPGDSFRLLFLSSGTRDASSSTIGDYDTFIQNAVAAGHTDIQTHSSEFKVFGSTSSDNAKDHTGTTGTGVPIYWLNGSKVADNYADFYDGSWDNVGSSHVRNESGNTFASDSARLTHIFTGTDTDGTGAEDSSQSRKLGNSGPVASGSQSSGSNPIRQSTREHDETQSFLWPLPCF